MNISIFILALLSNVPETAPKPEDGLFPDPPFTQSGREFSVLRTHTRPSVEGIGPKLSAKLRHAEGPFRVLVQGVPKALIEAHGFQIGARVGPVFSAYAMRAAIIDLAEQMNASNRSTRWRIDLGQSLRHCLNLATEQLGAAAVHRGEGLLNEYLGKDVVVAAYDSGIDFEHPAFQNKDGKSKVLGFWNQDTALRCGLGHTPISDCTHQDTNGHGSLVLSAAASSSAKYPGTAPGAELIVASSSKFEDLVGALAWFSSSAQALKKPMVVNLSLSGHEGPHDGTSLESMAINALPQLVVTAAGNDGEKDVHVGGLLSKTGEFIEIPINFRNTQGSAKVWIETWSQGEATIQARIQVRGDSNALLAQSSSVSDGRPGISETLMGPNGALFKIKIDAAKDSNPYNGKHQIRAEIEVEDLRELYDAKAKVSLYLTGKGQFDTWIDAPATTSVLPWFSEKIRVSGQSKAAIEQSKTISDIATASAAISVSSLIGRNLVRATTTNQTFQIDQVMGQISDFSSYGPSCEPSRTGLKPDVIAPGEVVVVAASAANLSAERIDDQWLIGSGTSISSALISGVAALVLSADRGLSRDQLRQELIASATELEASSDPRQGHGRVNAHTIITKIAPQEAECSCRHLGKPEGELRAWALILLLFLSLSRPNRKKSQ